MKKEFFQKPPSVVARPRVTASSEGQWVIIQKLRSENCDNETLNYLEQPSGMIFGLENRKGSLFRHPFRASAELCPIW